MPSRRGRDSPDSGPESLLGGRPAESARVRPPFFSHDRDLFTWTHVHRGSLRTVAAAGHGDHDHCHHDRARRRRIAYVGETRNLKAVKPWRDGGYDDAGGLGAGPGLA